jgi:2-phosphoglycerate kinase
MFYLIGGTPRSGKTTIAKRLSRELNIPWITTDTLETIVSKYAPQDRFQELFPKTMVRKETNQSNDEMYEKYSAKEIKDLYIKQAETLWDALIAFIECESRCEHDYVLEGFHIPPELIVEMRETYPMKSIFVGRENEKEMLEAITKGTKKDDWVINKTINPEIFSKIAKMLALFSTDVRTEAEKRGLKYLDMGTDLEKNVAEALEYLKDSK